MNVKITDFGVSHFSFAQKLAQVHVYVRKGRWVPHLLGMAATNRIMLVVIVMPITWEQRLYLAV